MIYVSTRSSGHTHTSVWFHIHFLKFFHNILNFYRIYELQRLKHVSVKRWVEGIHCKNKFLACCFMENLITNMDSRYFMHMRDHLLHQNKFVSNALS